MTMMLRTGQILFQYRYVLAREAPSKADLQMVTIAELQGNRTLSDLSGFFSDDSALISEKHPLGSLRVFLPNAPSVVLQRNHVRCIRAVQSGR
jgi:hypothetical protein